MGAINLPIFHPHKRPLKGMNDSSLHLYLDRKWKQMEVDPREPRGLQWGEMHNTENIMLRVLAATGARIPSGRLFSSHYLYSEKIFLAHTPLPPLLFTNSSSLNSSDFQPADELEERHYRVGLRIDFNVVCVCNATALTRVAVNDVWLKNKRNRNNKHVGEEKRINVLVTWHLGYIQMSVQCLHHRTPASTGAKAAKNRKINKGENVTLPLFFMTDEVQCYTHASV